LFDVCCEVVFLYRFVAVLEIEEEPLFRAPLFTYPVQQPAPCVAVQGPFQLLPTCDLVELAIDTICVMSSSTQLSLLSITNGSMQSNVDILRLWVRLLEIGVEDHVDGAVLFFKELAPKLTGLHRFLTEMQPRVSNFTTPSQINRLGVESTSIDVLRGNANLPTGRQVRAFGVCFSIVLNSI
jgi:hypothetical protein